MKEEKAMAMTVRRLSYVGGRLDRALLKHRQASLPSTPFPAFTAASHPTGCERVLP